MHMIGCYKNKKGVGSIIGGIFFLLIMIMGYTLFQIGNQAVKSQEQNLNNMRVFDLERSQEILKQINDPVLLGENLYVTLRNDGPRQSIVRNIGVWDGTNWVYSNIEIWINQGGTKDIPINIPGIGSAPHDTTYLIQLITDRGNIFPASFTIE
jgi:hypothetical protein